MACAVIAMMGVCRPSVASCARIAAVADRKGKLERRYDADVVLLNTKFEVERVWARGHEVGTV